MPVFTTISSLIGAGTSIAQGIMGANQADAAKRERIRQDAFQNQALTEADFEERKKKQQKRATEANAAMTKDVASKRADGVKGAAAGTLLGGTPGKLGDSINKKLY